MTDFLEIAARKNVYQPDRHHLELGNAVRRYFGCNKGVNANIEELATFLVSEASERFSGIQRDVAYRQLLDVIRATLAPLWHSVKHTETVSLAQALAQACVDVGIPVVTFNYDLIFDNLLHRTGKWNPLFGYGGSLMVAGDVDMRRMDLPPIGSMVSGRTTKTVLLKMHGSLNWGTRTVPHPDGTQPVELSPSGLLRDLLPKDIPIAKTVEETSEIAAIDNSVIAHGVPGSPNYYYQSLIIPPLANKSDWYRHPFVRHSWYHAYAALSKAPRIFVVGYSLPPGDSEAVNLFREALGSPFNFNDGRAILLVNPDKSVKDRFGHLSARPQVLIDHVYEDCTEWLRSEYSSEVE